MSKTTWRRLWENPDGLTATIDGYTYVVRQVGGPETGAISWEMRIANRDQLVVGDDLFTDFDKLLFQMRRVCPLNKWRQIQVRGGNK